MSCFRSVAHLKFISYRFNSFWDLRRCVVALPSLLELSFYRTSWPPLVLTPTGIPSIPFAASKLRHVFFMSMSDNTAPSCDTLWLWAGAPSRFQAPQSNYSKSEHVCLAFTKIDAIHVTDILRGFTGEPINIKWQYDQQLECHKCEIPKYHHIFSY